MELSFDSSRGFKPNVIRRHRRMTRARWWFSQMRRAVEKASDGSEMPSAEQTLLELTRRTSPTEQTKNQLELN